jgi:iron uptake system component EfeO
VTVPSKLTLAGIAALSIAAAGCGKDSADTGGKKGARTVKITLNDKGCEPNTFSIPAGATNFAVRNEGTAAVTEFEVLDGDRILGEVENVAAGLSKTFSLTLQPGTYTTYCPGGSGPERGKLTVTGQAVAQTKDPKAATAVTAYRRFLEEQAGELVARTRAFAAAVRDRDVAKAKALYGPARAPYERIEPVAESFGNLDPAIDARAGDVPKSQWTGFHPIERSLWMKETTAGHAKTADKLVADVLDLQTKVRTVKLEPAQIANGAVELLGEVSKSKITGEEERYSHIDLLDFEANVAGAKSAFEAVRPMLRGGNAALADEIATRFGNVEAALEDYRRGEGFVSYTQLDRADTRKLSQAIDALAEPLSRVPSRIVA